MAISKAFIDVLLSKTCDSLLNCHINKITMLTDCDFMFSKSRDCKRKFFISLNNHEPFFTLCNEQRSFSSKSSPFLLSLKKELENGIIIAIERLNQERILKITISNTNDSYKKIRRYLYIELIPNQTNLVLTDESDKILHALKYSTSINNERLIMRNITYAPPKKIGVESNFSLFERELLTKENIDENTIDLNTLYLDSSNYSCIPSQNATIIDLNTLYERYLVTMETKHRSDISNEVTLTILHHEKSLNKKLGALKRELENAQKCDNYRQMGDLLLTYKDEININKGKQEIEFEGLIIPLNPTLDIVQNANEYYKKYAKMKRSLSHIEEQIALTNDKIFYFNQLHTQLENSNDNDIKGIEYDLMSNGYLHKKELKKKNSYSQGMSQPYYYFIDNIKIGFGKNNIQNNYLTFSLAKKNYFFLHVKNKPGAHVIIFDDNPSNQVIKKAAMIALINSKLDDGEVQITKRSNVKKINNFGKVSLTSYQSIYIRKIDESLKKEIINLKK